jgi:prepilin-type N-terminal cleavage/methylation domain-containing protein
MLQLHPNRSARTCAGPPLLLQRCRHAFTLMEMLVVVVILAAVAALVVANVDGTREDAEAVVARAAMQTLAEALTGSANAPGYLADMKYIPGFNGANLQTHDLLSPSRYPLVDSFDPVANRGWRGPYLRNPQGAANTNTARNGRFPTGNERRFQGDATFLERQFFYDATGSYYGVTGDLVAADPWGNPIVVQVPPASAFNSADDVERFRYARLVSAGPDGFLATRLDDRLAGMLPDGTAAARGDDLVIFLNRSDMYEDEQP